MMIAGNEDGLLKLAYGQRPAKGWINDNKRFGREIKAIQKYLQGNAYALDKLPWKMGRTGTPFQCRVWKKISSIPVGATRTYGEIAASIGKPGGARAVGGACNANPLPLLIPCHRVMGQNRQLTGYSSGLDKKRILLNLENAKILA
jgi:methylated-DNA-[protein]-cysteine S-methyltransferase